MATKRSELQSFNTALQRCMEQALTFAALPEYQQAGQRRRQGGHSNFMGVTKHKRTQRYEGHVWLDKKQVYLGAYDVPEQAACGHDIMALRSKGSTDLNFPAEMYADVLQHLAHLPQAEVVSSLRTFSKSLSARGSGGGGASSSRGPGGGSRASSGYGGGAAAGSGGATSSAAWGGGQAGGGATSSLRGANKRKPPTPSASVTDLQSLQQQQEAAVAVRTAVAPGGLSERPRRQLPQRRAAAAAAGALHLESAGSLTLSDEEGAATLRSSKRRTGPAAAAGSRKAPQAAAMLAPVGAVAQQALAGQPLANISTCAGLPPRGGGSLQQPYSPLKIAPLQLLAGLLPSPLVGVSGSARAGTPPLQAVTASVGLLPPMVATPVAYQPWPLPSFTPLAPRHLAAAHTNQLLQQLPSLHTAVPSTQQQQHQQQQKQQQGVGHGGQPELVPLQPAVASRAAQELASIEAALQDMAGAQQLQQG